MGIESKSVDPTACGRQRSSLSGHGREYLRWGGRPLLRVCKPSHQRGRDPALAAPSFSTQSRNHDRDPPGILPNCPRGLGWSLSAKIVLRGNLVFQATPEIDRRENSIYFQGKKHRPCNAPDTLSGLPNNSRLTLHQVPGFSQAFHRLLTTVATGSRLGNSRWDSRLGFSYSSGLGLLLSLPFSPPHPAPLPLSKNNTILSRSGR